MSVEQKMQQIASRGVETALASLEEIFGFRLNLFHLQTPLPRILRAEAALAEVLLLRPHGLGRTQIIGILLAAAAEYGNGYWVAAYHSLLRSMGVAELQLEKIVFDARRAGLPPREQAVIDFALELATNPQELSGREIAGLREQGLADQSILDVILTTALSRLLCTLAAALHPALDFQSRAIAPDRNPSPRKKRAGRGISGPYLRQAELNAENFPPFAFFRERFGFIPSLFRAQTLRPDVIEAEADMVRGVLLPEDLLSHFQKECMLLVGSAVNLNTYCVAAHCEMLRAMGVPLEMSDQIAVDHHLADLSTADKAVLDFARKLTARPREFHSGDIETLRDHGFSGEHILEMVAVVALNNFFNTVQMGLGTTPDIEPRHVYDFTDVRLPESLPSIPADPDTELVRRVQDGDLAAFEELLHRHNGRVYRTLVAIIGNHEEAQDATQDTFLKAFEHIARFERRSKFSTWLLSIASNTALQRLRERRPLERLDQLGGDRDFRPRQLAAWHADPEQLYSLAETRTLVEYGLMKVPAKYRAALVLRDLEQLSTDDAAKAMGLRLSAFKARLFRGRMMLREALSPHFAVGAARTGS